MIRSLALVVIAALARAAWAGPVTVMPPVSVMQTCSSGCVAGSDPAGASSTTYRVMDVTGAAWLVAQLQIGGTAGRVALEHCAEDSPARCDAEGTWYEVAGAYNDTVGTVGRFDVVPPGRYYRTRVTTCTACTFRTVLSVGRSRTSGF